MIRFETAKGIDVPAVTVRQMREIDRIATEETGPNLLQMMENAGRNLAMEAVSMLGAGWAAARVLVLAGTGGNGGGGICAARHLANRGVDVALCLSRPERLGEIPAFQRHVYSWTPGREIGSSDVGGERPDLVVDALIGYSLLGAPRGTAARLIERANGFEVPILALDVPSGIDANTGQRPGPAVRAAATLTLALPKTGLLPDLTGRLTLADLGIPAAVYERAGIAYADPFGDTFRLPLRAA